MPSVTVPRSPQAQGLQPVPRLFLLVVRSKLWTTFPTRAFTTSKEPCGERMYFSASMLLTKDTHSRSGSVRFQAMLTWKFSERAVLSGLTCAPAVGELVSIGPSPLPPTYSSGCPDFCAASLHASRSLFNSFLAGFLMPSTKNHRFRSKFGTHFRPQKSRWKAWTAALRKETCKVSRKDSRSSVLICSVRESETCNGKGAPSSDCRDGMMSGTISGFVRLLFSALMVSLIPCIKVYRRSDSFCDGTPRTR